MLGYNETELVGKPLTSLFGSPEYLEGYKNFAQKKKMHEGFFDADIKTKSNSFVPMNFSFTPIIDNEVITGYITIARDITERKKHELILEKANEELESKVKERTAELEELISNKDKLFSVIAHDLKSPFTAILGYSDYLAQEIEDLSKEEIKSYAASINTSAVNIFKLLSNLLEWSILQTTGKKYHPENFNLNSLIKENLLLFEIIALDKNIKLHSDIKNDVILHADKNMTESIIRNLISNALKFTHEKGTISITAEIKNEFAEICVCDTGIGMTDKEIEKLFLLSHEMSREGTKKEKGTGLGLLLCKEFVTKNGGKIWAESDKLGGSKFIFTLPLEKLNA